MERKKACVLEGEGATCDFLPDPPHAIFGAKVGQAQVWEGLG